MKKLIACALVLVSGATQAAPQYVDFSSISSGTYLPMPAEVDGFIFESPDYASRPTSTGIFTWLDMSRTDGQTFNLQTFKWTTTGTYVNAGIVLTGYFEGRDCYRPKRDMRKGPYR
jgi:hypothetical protein